MKTLFFECNMGAAGDMLMAALLELHNDPDGFINRLNAVGIPGVIVNASASVKYGIAGTQVTVTVNGVEESTEDIRNENYGMDHQHLHEHSHERIHTQEYQEKKEIHHHNDMRSIENIINGLCISERVKEDALEVYNLIAEAESHAHNAPVTEIHFHEVGAMDAITDIVGVCMLMEELAPEMILASPIHVGSGQVQCAHGILPVPAPATAYLLKGVPIYGGSVNGELCTPTGAALLKYFVKKFDVMPIMTVSGIGYGMGKKNFDRVSCVRAYVGETNINNKEVTELICNLDDMTPEAVAFAGQLLLDEGALDVYTTSIGMKKGRCGILFTCMCSSKLVDKIVSLIFKHTTTLGIREKVSRRYTLHRKQDEIQTQYGAVRVKTAFGYGVTKTKPEYEDIAKIARDNGLSIKEVMDKVLP